MKKIIICSMVATLAMASQVAKADEAAPPTTSSKKLETVMDHVPSGVYVEGDLGYSIAGAGFYRTYDTTGPGYAAPQEYSTNLSNGGLGYNVNLGYQFTNNIGIEVGATKYASRSGSVDMTHQNDRNPQHIHSDVGSVESSNAHMFDVAGRFALPVTAKFDVFGKLGLAYLSRDLAYQENTMPISAVSSDSTDHGLGVLYGVGMEYNFTQHVAWTAEATGASPFSSLGGSGHNTIDDSGTPSMFLVSTGLKYTF